MLEKVQTRTGCCTNVTLHLCLDRKCSLFSILALQTRVGGVGDTVPSLRLLRLVFEGDSSSSADECEGEPEIQADGQEETKR